MEACEPVEEDFEEPEQAPVSPPDGSVWTEAENDVLRRAYAERGDRTWFWRLARALHRGAKEISTQAERLGVALLPSSIRSPRVRAHSIPVPRYGASSLALGCADYPDDVDRPKTRADCQGGERPCPFVSCEHHLYLDVNPCSGSLKLNFPDLEVDEMTESCVLDVADRGGMTLEEVGAVLNLTRERVRQIEVRGLLKLREMGVD